MAADKQAVLQLDDLGIQDIHCCLYERKTKAGR